jgi:hypothetical protein
MSIALTCCDAEILDGFRIAKEAKFLAYKVPMLNEEKSTLPYVLKCRQLSVFAGKLSAQRKYVRGGRIPVLLRIAHSWTRETQ